MRLQTFASFLLLSGLAFAQPETVAPAPAFPGPRFGFGVELGANSLASIGGLTLTYYPTQHLALDAGAGFGLGNWKYGLRGRYLFLDGKVFHPYAGAAVKYATGWGDHSLSMTAEATENGRTTQYDFEMTVDPAFFADLMGGIEFRFGHFQLRPGVGYSQMLGSRNWKVVEGDAPQGKAKDAIDIIEGSGISFFLGAGFAY